MKAKSVRFRFTRELPLLVMVQGVKWAVFRQTFPKGKEAIVASSGSVRGYFAGGRPSEVEAALFRGIEVPVGTRRHLILQAMVAQRYAVYVREERAWDDLG